MSNNAHFSSKIGVFMKTTMTTTVRLMMTNEPQEKTLAWTDKQGNARSRVRESLNAFLLGTGSPLTKIDININKFVGSNQFREVKLVDLYKTFVKNEDELRSGKKVILANLELIPQKNALSDEGEINAFVPYLKSYDVADATEDDSAEIEAIIRNSQPVPEEYAAAQ